MSLIKASQSVTVFFGTSDPSDGSATNADSTPTGTLYENGSDTGQTVTVSNVATGLYTAAFTIPSGAADEDVYDLVIVATVGGVTGRDSVWRGGVESLVWASGTRTLTSSAAAVTSAVEGSVLNIVPTVTFSATISGLTIPSDWDKIYLTIKESKDDPDSESLAQLVVTNGGDPDDGIVYLDKTAIASSDADANDGSLTVDQGAGTVDIAINDEATAELLSHSGDGGRPYDLKALKTDNESELLTESTASFDVSTTRTHTA